MISHELAICLKSWLIHGEEPDDDRTLSIVPDVLTCLDEGGRIVLDARACKDALAEYDAETKRLFTVARFHSFPFSGIAMLIIDKLERHVGVSVGDSATTPLAIVERSEIERLQALERKINAFLDGCFLAIDFSGAAGVVINGGISIHMVRHNEWDVHWPGGCCRSQPSNGALRKAFELFEVPGK